MCNYLHYNHKHLPSKGFGYKLFNGNGESLVGGMKYVHDRDGLVVFQDKLFYNIGTSKQYGFCFFPSMRVAKIAAEAWNPTLGMELDKIEYFGGLGQHDEDNFMGAYIFRIGICKSFKRLYKNIKINTS